MHLLAFFHGAHKKDEDRSRDQREPPNLWTGIQSCQLSRLFSHLEEEDEEDIGGGRGDSYCHCHHHHKPLRRNSPRKRYFH